MREKNYVVIIGSANIDVAGYSHESLNYADSNPGKIKFTPGGVGRNIAQNLALLGNKAWLLSAVGSDFYGQSLLTQTNQSGVYVDKCLIVPEKIRLVIYHYSIIPVKRRNEKRESVSR